MGIRKYPIDPGLVPMFTGRAPTLPRTRGVQLPSTEATADASTFVCEFLGGSSANETGVGLGLTGADLVLTQVGSVAASSGGVRVLNGSSQYFTCTAAFATALFNNPEWTLAYQFKSYTQRAVDAFAYMIASGTSSYFYPLTRTGPRLLTYAGVVQSEGTSITAPLPATSSLTWLCFWRKGGNTHVGWVTQAALPTSWDSFPANQRGVIGQSTQLSGTWDTLQLVGGVPPGATSPALSIGTLVASKIGLTAAPV